MGLFNQSIEKKREKEIRREAKEISKELAAFGMDKKATKEYLEVFQELLIDACLQKDCLLKEERVRKILWSFSGCYR